MRHFEPISLEEFKKIVDPFIASDDDEFPFNLPDSVQFDVECDYENVEHEESFMNYPIGYEVLANEMPVLFLNAGGDWELPICMVIYWDGEALRGYVPQKGNMWNREERVAFGSEAYADDEDFIRNTFKNLLEEARQWVAADEIEKYLKVANEDNYDYQTFVPKLVSKRAIFEDIQENILKK